jgi:calcium-dependent protein kinase
MGQCPGSKVCYNEQAGELQVRPRVVGRERRYLREERIYCREAPKISLTASERQGWSGNVRLASLVSPKNRSFADEYELTKDSIGSGMSGDVFLARPRHPTLTGNVVAVKRLEKKGLTKKDLKRLLTEVDIYVNMDHCNIARLLKVFDEPDRIYLVMEYCSGGTLATRLAERGRFDEVEAATAIKQVLSAVAYCHSRPQGKVVHKDLKLDNFVYNTHAKDSGLKLVDFGLSSVLQPGKALASVAGTLEFMAPELLRQEKHSEGCDLWSVGILSYALLAGGLPVQGSEDEIQNAILQGDWLKNDSLWSGLNESAKSFVQSLLHFDATLRPSAEAALKHPWLTIAPDVESSGCIREILTCIEGFANENEMRRASAAIAVYSEIELGGPDVENAELEFQHIDSDHNGVISRQEMTDVLHHNLGLAPDKCDFVFRQLDFDGNQEISRNEFLAAAVGARLLNCNSTVRKAFECFDVTKDGVIELREMTGIFGNQFCGTPTRSIFSKLDTNGDRKVSYDEFKAMVVGTDQALTESSKSDIIEV